MKILQKYSRITVNLQNMSDTLTPDQRHRNMAAIHSASTRPELKLRHALWQLGFRYRMNDRKLPGKPDIVLPKYRTVIFVHGCFWHGHNGCKFYTVPKRASGVRGWHQCHLTFIFRRYAFCLWEYRIFHHLFTYMGVNPNGTLISPSIFFEYVVRPLA